MGPCAYCRQAAAAPRRCSRCRALYHDDCWDANDRRCAIYGCEPARPAAFGPVQVIPPPAAPRLNLGWLVFALIMAANLPRLLSTRLDERPPLPPPSPAVFAEIHPRDGGGPAGQARFLVRQADALVVPLSVQPGLPVSPELVERRRRDLDFALVLLERARAAVAADRGMDAQRREIELRIAELRRLRPAD